jgi:hypothetical protein
VQAPPHARFSIGGIFCFRDDPHISFRAAWLISLQMHKETTMRKLILVAALAFLGTSAHAGPSRGLVLAAAESAPAAAPAAASTAPATQAAPAPAAPAKPDKAQAIFEQLVKHGVIKLPNQAPAAAATTTAPATAPAVTTAPAPVATTAAPAPAAVAQPAPAPVAAAPAAPVAKVAVEKPSEPKKVSRAETRIRSELRRHGIY